MRSSPVSLLVSLAAALAFTGCPDDVTDDDTAADDDTTAGDDDTTAADDDTTGGDPAITITGTVVDITTLSTGAPTPPGNAGELSISAADPAPALIGQAPEVLGTATVNADGTFSIPEVMASGATLGLLLIVDDAADADVATATGVPFSSFVELGDGETLNAGTAFSISTAAHDSMEEGLTIAGWAGDDLVGVGALVGFVQDSADAPVAGATISSSGVDDIFYADVDLWTGNTPDAFVNGGAPNTATDAGGLALFVIPDAPIGNYSCTAAGYDFGSDLTAGSQDNILLIISFNAS